MRVEDSTIRALATSLNFRQMRQKILSSNIANAQTPGFKARRMDFEEALARALDVDGQNRLHTEEGRHYNVGGGGFGNLRPVVYDDPRGVIGQDGNTVNKEDEMARMADNEILYDASVQLLKKKLSLKNYAVSTER